MTSATATPVTAAAATVAVAKATSTDNVEEANVEAGPWDGAAAAAVGMATVMLPMTTASPAREEMS